MILKILMKSFESKWLRSLTFRVPYNMIKSVVLDASSAHQLTGKTTNQTTERS